MLSNEDYLKRYGFRKGTEGFTLYLRRMNGYGDNRWWLAEDPKVRAYFQTKELLQSGFMLLPDTYANDVTFLLGRKATLNAMRAGDISPEEIIWCYENQKSSEDYLQDQFDQMAALAKKNGTFLFIGDASGKIRSVNSPKDRSQTDTKTLESL